MANILILYNATQTYTQTVYEHLMAFSTFSEDHSYFFTHASETTTWNIKLSSFDAVIIHYTIRLPFDQVSESWAGKIAAFSGHKALFIQDEYDHTQRTWHWLKRLGINTIFTVVPEQNMHCVYPEAELPNLNRVNVLTGYVPADLSKIADVAPPSKRTTLINHRGRDLPARYGKLGQEKLRIGIMVKAYADEHGFPTDIAWTEDARIYGSSWYDFVASARATLGTESGSNIFDWDGTLQKRIDAEKADFPDETEEQIVQRLGIPDEDGLMNQISPRVFEAIALRTALVLYRGEYSGVLQPDLHYIPLEKDGSNLEEVFTKLQDDDLVDELTDRAHRDVLQSERWSYQSFVTLVNSNMPLKPQSDKINAPKHVTELPQKFAPPVMAASSVFLMLVKGKYTGVQSALLILGYFGRILPSGFRRKLAPYVKKMLRI